MKILLFLLSLMLIGCTSLYPPARKGWVEVTAPPYRTQVICDEKTITGEFVSCIISDTKDGKFKDYKFNDSATIDVTALGETKDIRDHSNTLTVLLDEGE
jgi:hypothetical protein